MWQPWDQLKQYLEAEINADIDACAITPSVDESKFPALLAESSLYPIICDLIKSETRRAPSGLTVFLGNSTDDLPLEIISLKIQELSQIYIKSELFIEIFYGDWFNLIPKNDAKFLIPALFDALNTDSVLVLDISADFSSETFDLRATYWQKNWQTYITNHQHISLASSNCDELDQRQWLEFQKNWLELIPRFVEIFVALQFDQHFFLSGFSPLLPELLSTYWAKDFWRVFSEDALKTAEKLDRNLELSLEKTLAGFYLRLNTAFVSKVQNICSNLDLAASLAHLRSKSFAEVLVIEFMEAWLKSRQIEFEPNSAIPDLAALMQAALQLEDWQQITKLNSCLLNLDADYRLDFMGILTKEEFDFAILRMNIQGQVRQSRRNFARFFRQNLEPNLDLEMVHIPAGTMRMGSPRNEVGHETNESPMHWVMLSAFFMSKFPITQAQWQVITELPMVNRMLRPNPSDFLGANRPVENVSWYDAIEFCDRLKLKTGIPYRLPSEAEWEYACRAGTKTPFHFGETITSAIVNYDGTYPYGFGAKGEYRQHTTEVGSSNAANDYGLYDMHGQVLEWCADPWHDDYVDAPNDGQIWDQPGNHRVLRGGSWFSVAGRCRVASRHHYSAEVWLNHTGFRIALSPPKN